MIGKQFISQFKVQDKQSYDKSKFLANNRSKTVDSTTCSQVTEKLSNVS